MIRVNVGLSRKLSKDYNSSGFSINVEGEVTASVNDPEAVIEQVKELFDLAEEALAQQIDRTHADAAIGGRDAEPRPEPTPQTNGHRPASNGTPPRNNGNANTKPAANGNGHAEDQATNKQVQFLLSIAKRQGLSTADLERKITETLGHEVGVYELSKRDAAKMIDALNGATTNGRSFAKR